MPRQVSIRHKILLTFLIFFTLSLAVTVYGYYRYHVLNQKIHLVEKKSILYNSVLEARRYEKNFFITYQKKHLKSAIYYAEKSKKQMAVLKDAYGDYAHTDNMESRIQELGEYKASLENLFKLTEQVSSALEQSTDIPEYNKHKSRIRSLGRNVTASLNADLQSEREKVRNMVQNSRWCLFVFLGLIVLISFVAFLFLIIKVDKPLKSIEEAIEKIYKGDYQNVPEINTGDEFERLVYSLNQMLDELHRRKEQLVQNEKMIALGTLTSGVAHDLNNPLNNISTSLQIIQEELEEGNLEYQRELLNETENEVKRTQDIVKALLEFSRNTDFTLSREHFRSLVQNTIKLVQGEIPSGINVRIDIPDNIYSYLDPRRIQQVLINLCINAAQSMEDAGGEIIIRAFEAEAMEGFYFQVQDNGKGIEESKLSKIFDPFYTEKEVGKGSGLGLSVSKGIVESHGGHISVESMMDVGTVFTVFLPYYPEKKGAESKT